MHTNVTAGTGLSDDDAALLVEAHWDLMSALSSGVRVLGSTVGSELVTTAHVTVARGKAAAVRRVLQAGRDVRGWWSDPQGFVTPPAPARNEVPA